MNPLQRIALASVISTLTACGTFDGERRVKMGPTLADVKPAVMPDPTRPVPEIDIGQIEKTLPASLGHRQPTGKPGAKF